MSVIIKNVTGRFRGERNYYHSTDLYLSLEYFIHSIFENGDCKNLKINFRKLSTLNPVFSFQNVPFEQIKNLIADATFEINEVRWFCNIEEGETKIDERVDYEEVKIVNGSRREQFKRTLFEELKFHPIEVVTALSMSLLRENRALAEGEKWVLSHISMPDLLPHNIKNTEVTLKGGGGGVYSNLYVTFCNQSHARLIFCKIKT